MYCDDEFVHTVLYYIYMVLYSSSVIYVVLIWYFEALW